MNASTLLLIGTVLGAIGSTIAAGLTLWRAWHAANVPRLDFDDPTRAVIARAQATVQARGNAAITPEHLLLALLDEPTSASAVLLAHAGVNVDALRERLTPSAPVGKPGPEQILPLYTSRSKLTLVQAVYEASAQRHATVQPLHLLAGILREGRSLAARTLRDAGATLPVVRRATTLPG